MNNISVEKQKDISIHKSYKKRRNIVFIILILTLSFMSIGYSANLSSLLYGLGYITLDAEEGSLDITNIGSTTSTYVTSNTHTIDKKIDSNTTTLTSNFDLTFYRASGTSTPSITYDVEITNDTLKTQTLTQIKSTPTFSEGSSTLLYSITGANEGTTTIKPRSSLVVTVTLYLESSQRQTTYKVNEVLDFVFNSEDTSLRFSITPILQTTSIEFSTKQDIKQIKIYVKNNSENDVTFNVSTKNDNFLVVDSKGNSLSNLSLRANSEDTFSIYLQISNNHLFVSREDDIDLHVQTTSPKILTYSIGKVKAKVPECGGYTIFKDKKIYDDDSIDFTSTSLTSGIYKNKENGKITYFYRGNTTDNYVSFAGLTWRIIRIDNHGTRLILDSDISSTTTWASSNTASTLDAAISTMTYANSNIKQVLDKWYDDTLTSYSDVIKTSYFCQDFSYQSLTSTGSGNTTYYFGAYIRTGKDATEYTPTFTCKEEHTTTGKVGMINADEVSFAGGVFNSSNTNYYLYNTSITNVWWTLSPSYYDGTLTTVGIFIIDGSTGKLSDWQNASTIANANAIRPVITLDTDRLNSGVGSKDDPYTFS